MVVIYCCDTRDPPVKSAGLHKVTAAGSPACAGATAAQENGGDDADIQRAYQTAMNRWQAVLHDEALAAAVSRVPAAQARPRSADTADSTEAGAAAEERQPVRA